MGVNWFATKFSNIENQTALRFDPKYRKFWDVNKGNFISSKNSIPFYEILEEIKVTKLKKGELDEDYYLLNISDQQPKVVFLENLKEVNEIGSDKNPLWESDVIISKLGLPKGYIFLNDKEKFPKLIGSSELIPYKLKSDKYLPKFIVYFILLDNVLKCFSALESGRTPSHKRVSPNDLLKTTFPLVLKQNQERSLKEIEPIEGQIKHLKSQIQDPLVIINEVFAREFGYSTALWREFGKGMTAGSQRSNIRSFKYFNIPFAQIQTSNILRFSTRFHNPITQELTKILTKYPTVKVGEVITERVHRGVQPKFEPEGEVYTIKTAQLKNGYLDLPECEMVSQEFYQNNESAKVSEGDILIASTGKISLGKIDLIEFEDNAMVDGHVSIVRLDEKQYNKLFFTYFFRSILGTFQVERDFTGTTNQIELYADQIEAFDIPDMSLEKQESIVEKIKSELDKQKEIEREIDEKQKEISRIIEAAIKG